MREALSVHQTPFFPLLIRLHLCPVRSADPCTGLAVFVVPLDFLFPAANNSRVEV